MQTGCDSGNALEILYSTIYTAIEQCSGFGQEHALLAGSLKLERLPMDINAPKHPCGFHRNNPFQG